MNCIKTHCKTYGSIFFMTLIVFLCSLRQAETEEARFVKQTFPGGFKLKEPVVFYGSQNLYEYINGQAVFYLSYGFKRLEHGFYQKGDATYYVDVYELGSRLSSFGAFRQQREEDADKLNIGCEGAITDYLTVFYKGNFYIEIIPMSTESDDIEIMRMLAGHLEKLVPGEVDLPPEVSLFPPKGLIDGSERYVDEDLISYSFMGRGLYARYLPEGQEKEFRVFIALADSVEKAEKMTSEYKKKLQELPNLFSQLKLFIGKEQYRGVIMLSSYENYVFGCLDVTNQKNAVDVLSSLLGNIGKNIKAQKEK